MLEKRVRLSYGVFLAYIVLAGAISWLFGAYWGIQHAESPAPASPVIEAVEQLTDLKFGVIKLTLEDGSEKMFTCGKMTVNGPYALNQEAWLMVDSDQGTLTYVRGDYEALAAGGPYYLYQPDVSWNNQGLTAYWVMRVGDYYYTAEALYPDYAVNYEKYEGQSGSLWHPEYFNVVTWVLTGENSFAEEDTVQMRYDDESMIRERTQKWATWVTID